MNATRNTGTNRDEELYPFMVELGNRGGNDWQVFYINNFMQCTCGRINCQHVQAARDLVASEEPTLDEENAPCHNCGGRKCVLCNLEGVYRE